MWRYFSICALIILFHIPITLNSQLASGLYLTEYAGINGSIINPASSTSYPLKWDVNVVGVHAFGYSDYGFIKDTHLFHLLGNAGSLTRFPRDSDIASLNPDLIYYDFPLEIDERVATFQTEVNGPGVLLSFDKFNIGFFSRARASLGTHKIPQALSYWGIQNARINVDNQVESAGAQAMFWTEYGLSFSSDQIIPVEGLSVGMNLKYVRGHQGGYLKSTDSFTYNRNSEDSLQIQTPQLEYGVTSTLADDPSNLFQSNGNSISLDLGITLETSKGKLGVSILDIGTLRLSNAEVYTLQSTQSLSLNTATLIDNVDGREILNELDNQISDQLDRITTIRSGDAFSIGLPTRIHVNFTYPLKDKISIGGAIDHRLPIFSNSLEAENVMTIFPKYETKWFMITSPISFYEYEKLRIGLAARLGVLTIGTDHLPSLFVKSDFRGSSLYASLKIFPFGNGTKSASRSRGKNVDCPEVQ